MGVNLHKWIMFFEFESFSYFDLWWPWMTSVEQLIEFDILIFLLLVSEPVWTGFLILKWAGKKGNLIWTWDLVWAVEAFRLTRPNFFAQWNFWANWKIGFFRSSHWFFMRKKSREMSLKNENFAKKNLVKLNKNIP